MGNCVCLPEMLGLLKLEDGHPWAERVQYLSWWCQCVRQEQGQLYFNPAK